MAAPRTRRLPKLSEIQARWNSFRSACDLLSHEIDSSAKASISILRQSGHCVEITSDTLQRENSTFEIIIWSLVVYVILIIFWVLIFSGIAVYLFFLFLPASYVVGILSSRMLGARYRRRSSRVRIDRLERKVYYVSCGDDGRDTLWVLDWDDLLCIDYYHGRGQGYLYLVGYPLNLTGEKLVRIPIIGLRIGYSNASTWVWLQRYMAGDTGLPAPTIESPPRTWRDVLQRCGGRWVLESFTDTKRRWWLLLTIWVDLVIVLLIMPVMALPQLVILTYSEPQFPPDNDRLCGFALN